MLTENWVPQEPLSLSLSPESAPDSSRPSARSRLEWILPERLSSSSSAIRGGEDLPPTKSRFHRLRMTTTFYDTKEEEESESEESCAREEEKEEEERLVIEKDGATTKRGFLSK